MMRNAEFRTLSFGPPLLLIRQNGPNLTRPSLQFRLPISREFRKRPYCVPEGETGPTSQISQANDRVVSRSVSLAEFKEQDSLPIVVHVQQTSSFGWFWSTVMVFFLAVSTTSAALTAFLTYVRPLLKTFEETCKATEKTSKQLEIAAIELEEAAIMFDEKLPPALKSVEAAGKEFEELGQSLNSLSGGLISRRSSRHRRREKEQDSSNNTSREVTSLVAKKQSTGNSRNLTKLTMDSIQKVGSDINTITQSLGPAMDMWRRKLASVVTTVEAEQKVNRSNESIEESIASIEEYPTIIPRSVDSEDLSGTEVANNALSQTSAIGGVDIELDDINHLNNVEDEDDYGTLIGIQDLLKNKDSLVARLANESTTDAAEVIMDALYKAEQAAEDAAKASGALQEAVARAQNSGAWGVNEESEWDAKEEERLDDKNEDVKRVM